MKKDIIEIINSNDFNKEDKNVFLKTFSYEQRSFIVKNFIEIVGSTFYLKGYKFFNEGEIEKFYNENKETLFKYPEYDLMISSFFSIDFFQLVDDAEIEKLIQKENNQLFKQNLAYHLQSDKSKSLAIKKHLIDKKSLLYYLIFFENDSEKIKFLYTLSEYEKKELLSTIKDDSIKIKNIFKNKGSYGIIISSINDDQLKEDLLSRYSKFTNIKEKIMIISSFNDTSYIKNNIRIIMKYEEVYTFLKSFNVQKHSNDADSIIIELMNKVHLESQLCKIIKDCYFLFKGRDLLLCQEMLRIRSSDILVDVLETLDFDFYKKYLHMFIGRIDEQNRLQILNSIGGKIAIKYYQYLPSTKDISYLINNATVFPKYNSMYDDLINRYAQINHVDINNLKTLIMKTDLSILKYLKNDNIRCLLNYDINRFNMIISLIFDNALLNDDACNNVVNSLLQRKFKMDNEEVIGIFGLFLVAIDKQDLNQISKLLMEVTKFENISKYVDTDISVFINDLLNKDEKAVDILHNITNKYIVLRSNDYVKNNIQKSFDSAHDFCISKKNMFKLFDLEHMYQFVDKDELSFEETLLFEKREIMQKLYDFKLGKGLDPSLKKYEVLFNSIFNKYYKEYWHSQRNIERKQNINYDTAFFDYNDIENIILVLINTDFNKIKYTLDDSNENYNKLKEFLSLYKLFGWTKGLKKQGEDVGIYNTPVLMGTFLTYYDDIFSEVDKNTTFTKTMDLASCYLSSAKVYEKILGCDNAHYIISNPAPNASILDVTERINLAINDLKKIRKRKYVTIPAFEENYELNNGKLININIGNFSNPINLTYGERTASCMRTGNTGSSLYDFCLNNINGFHIRFTNPNNNAFISRVSGFRNGNTVFFNDLRYSISSDYSNLDLVETIKYVSNRIIQLTKDSKYPINYVIISKYHAMENNSNEIINLKVNSVNSNFGGFYTDISSHGIVLASSNDDENIKLDLNKDKVVLYNVLREKPKLFYDKFAQEEKIHMDSLNDLDNDVELSNINHFEIEKLKLCYSGEDWYIAIYENGNVETKIFDKSKNNPFAIGELTKAIEVINNIQYKDYLVKQYERKKNDWHSN